MPPYRQTLALAALAAGAALAVPATSMAASVDSGTGTITYQAAPGELNNVVLRAHPNGVVIEDLADITVRGSCQLLAPRRALCPPPTFVRVELGDRADGFTPFVAAPTVVNGQAGDDLFLAAQMAGPSNVQFFGGEGSDMASYQFANAGVFVHKDGVAADGRPGDHDHIASDVERIKGSPQGDVLSGDGGPEVFEHLEGADLVLGGGGDDLVLNLPQPDGADQISGGAGKDTVSYASRASGVSVTPDAGTANDGASTEQDDVIQAEVIEGGAGNDHLVVISRTSPGYTLTGRGGRDVLLGSQAGDTLSGGADLDDLQGGDGPDVLDSRDGVAEELKCGAGNDVALIDPLPNPGFTIGPGGRDRPVACESHPNVIVGSAGVDRARFAAGVLSLRVSWTHPEGWRNLRRIVLTLREGPRVVARRGFVPSKGKGRRVSKRLRLTVSPILAGSVLGAEVVGLDRRGRREVVRIPAAVVLHD